MHKKLEYNPRANDAPLNPIRLLPGVSFSLSFRLLCVWRICHQRMTLFCEENFDLGPNQVLILMAASEHHLHQGIMAKSLGIDKNAMVFQIDKLEVRGLITRIPNPDNRRARLIECTSKGRELVAEIKADYPKIVRWILYPLNGDQLEQFGTLLGQIIEGESLASPPMPIVHKTNT